MLKTFVSSPCFEQNCSKPAFPALPCTWNARNPLFYSVFGLGGPSFCKTACLDAQSAGFQAIFAANPLRTRVSRPSVECPEARSSIWQRFHGFPGHSGRRAARKPRLQALGPSFAQAILRARESRTGKPAQAEPWTSWP